MRFLLTSTYANVAEQLPLMISGNLEDIEVAFIATAADVYEDKSFVDVDRNKLIEQGFKIREVTLSNYEQIKSDVEGCEVIFVAGGNTFYLLQESIKSSFDLVLKGLADRNKIYVGSSAGAVLVGPDISLVGSFDDPSKAPELKDYTGLHLIDFVVLPHYGKPKYEERYQDIIKRATVKGVKTKLLRDDEYVVV